MEFLRSQFSFMKIGIEVDKFDKCYGDLTNKVASVGGYILNVNTTVNESESYTNMQVRIPVTQFDNFLNYVRGLGTITSENISTQDAKLFSLCHIARRGGKNIHSEPHHNQTASK